MTGASPPAPPAVEATSRVAQSDNRFLIVAVACRRVLQIRSGSRARLDAGGHKPCAVAVAEVMAGVVPYYAA